MYYVITNIDSHDCNVKKFETLPEAIEWAEKFDNSIITKELNSADKFIGMFFEPLQNRDK